MIAALPDSVIGKPLGMAEARMSRGAPTSAKSDELDFSKAIATALPETLAPQLATLASDAPSEGDWIVETKFDGYRLLTRIDAGRARLFTRGGHDWTHKMPTLAKAIEALGIESGWIDGEIVVLDADGLPDFNALQNALDGRREQSLIYFVFDAPFFEDFDLRAMPLRFRRDAINERFRGDAAGRVRLSQTLAGPIDDVLRAACKLGLEGIMVKRADSPYVEGRTRTWLKLKCALRQEFVVYGFTDRSDAPDEVGSLLLAVHDDRRLRPVGAVGTGWDAKASQQLHARLTALESSESAAEPHDAKRNRWSTKRTQVPRWVKPVLLAEVSFGEWTPDGQIRHAVFKGLRSDKPARSIAREAAVTTKITHPDRVIDGASGLKKIDLVRYYEEVARRMLPHLKGRPTSLVRAPEGVEGALFFQKHLESRMPGVTQLDAALWPGHAGLLSIDTAQALVSAAQMNVIEFHPWNAKASKIDLPDRIVFDLDPGEGVKWKQLQDAAHLVRAMLEELGLACWLKTSGGKGLHIVVPIAAKLEADVVKQFSQDVVQHLAQTFPQRIVAKSGPANRVGKIFVDYLRNGHGQTTAAAFSARSRPGLGVSMPVHWDQLKSLKSAAQWTVANAVEYLSFEQVDPWAEFWSCRQTLTRARQALEQASDK